MDLIGALKPKGKGTLYKRGVNIFENVIAQILRNKRFTKHFVKPLRTPTTFYVFTYNKSKDLQKHPTHVLRTRISAHFLVTDRVVIVMVI